MNIYEDGLDGEEYDGLRHFQLNVIILEGRHLYMFNSDTKVIVSVGKRKKILRSKTTKTDAPYFNELCIFNFYLPLGVLLDEILKIRLYGVPKLKRNRLVGSFSVELATIWSQPNHQFYHKWAALTDPKNPAGGVKGYLKCDIALLTQGIKSKSTDRDPAENIENHMLVPFGEINDRQRARFVFSLFRADNFSNYFSTEPYRTLYAYVRITYAGLSGKTTIASGTFNPSWNQELAFVEMIPALCQYVHIEICDALKATSSGILGSANLDLRKLSHENENGFLPTYGPSFLYLYQNFAKFHKHNKCALVNSSFTYMCRLLMALRTEVVDYAEDVLANKKNNIAIKPKSIPLLDETKYFKYNEFMLFAAVFDVLLFDTSIMTNRVSFRVNIGPDKPATDDGVFKYTTDIKTILKKKDEDGYKQEEDSMSSVKTKRTVIFEDEQLKNSEILIKGITVGEGGKAPHAADEETSDESPRKSKFKFKDWNPKGSKHWLVNRRQKEHDPEQKWKIYNDTKLWKPLRQLRYWPNEFKQKRKRSGSDAEIVSEKKPFKTVKLEGLIKNFKSYQKLNSFMKSNDQKEKQYNLGKGDSSKELDSGMEELIGESGSSTSTDSDDLELPTGSSHNEKYSEGLLPESEPSSTEETPQEKGDVHFPKLLPSSKEWHSKKKTNKKSNETKIRKEKSSRTPSEIVIHEKETGTDFENNFSNKYNSKIETVPHGRIEKSKDSSEPEVQSDTESKTRRLRKKLEWNKTDIKKSNNGECNVNNLKSLTAASKQKEIPEARLSSESGKESLMDRKRKLFKKWSEEWKRKRRERLEQASFTSSTTTETIRSKFREWRKYKIGTDYKAIRKKEKGSETDRTKRRKYDRIKKASTSPRDWKILKKRKYLSYWPTDWRTVKRAFPLSAKVNKRKRLKRIGLIHLRKELFKKPITKTDQQNFLSGSEEKTDLYSVRPIEEESENVTTPSNYNEDNFYGSGNFAKRSILQEEVASQKIIWQEQSSDEGLPSDSLFERGDKKWQRMKGSNKGSRDSSKEFHDISETNSNKRFKRRGHAKQGRKFKHKKEEKGQSFFLIESDTSTSSSHELHLEDHKNLHSSASTYSEKPYKDELSKVVSITESKTHSTSNQFPYDLTKKAGKFKGKEKNNSDIPESELDKKKKRNKNDKFVFFPNNTTNENVKIYFSLKKELPEESFPPKTSNLAYYAKTENPKKFNFFRKKREQPEHILQLSSSEIEIDTGDEEYGEMINDKPQKSRIRFAVKRESEMRKELINGQRKMNDIEETNLGRIEKEVERKRKKFGKEKGNILKEPNKRNLDKSHFIVDHIEAEGFPDPDKNDKIKSEISGKKQKRLPTSVKNITQLKADKTDDNGFETEASEINPKYKDKWKLEKKENSSELKKGSNFIKQNGKPEAIEKSEENFSDYEQEPMRKENKFRLKSNKASTLKELMKPERGLSKEFPYEKTNKHKRVKEIDKIQENNKLYGVREDLTEASRSTELMDKNESPNSEDEKETDMQHIKKRDRYLKTLKKSSRENNKSKGNTTSSSPEENKYGQSEKNVNLNNLSEDGIHQLEKADNQLQNIFKGKKKMPKLEEKLIEYESDEIIKPKKRKMFRSKKSRKAPILKIDQTLDRIEQNFPDPNEPKPAFPNQIKHVRIYNGCNTTPSKPVTVRQNYGFTSFSGNYPCIHINGEWPNALRRLYRSNVVQKSVIKFKTGLAEIENDIISENRMIASEKLKKIYITLSEDCHNILRLTNKIEPEDTNLYRERKRYYHKEIKDIIQKAEIALKKKILIVEDELKRANNYLTTLVRFAQDPEDSFPDTEIWLIKDGKSVAQHRMKTQKIVFSPDINERGILSGKIQSVIARGREGQELAKIDIFMWFGLGNHFAECQKLLPPGFKSETHKCPGTSYWDVPLLLSYTEEHYFQCRIHLFQARILVGTDVTGLADPFVRATVLTQIRESQIKKETLNPIWDETLVFSKLIIHGPANYIRDNSITITIEVMDYDFLSKNELIGRTLLKPAVRLHDEEYKPPKLAWEEIRKECSETGKILLAAEMWEISKDDPEELGKLEKIPIPDRVRPVSVGHRLEVLFWGVREVKRKFPKTMKILVTLECGGKHITSPVMKNTNKNSNFPGTVQTLDLELPEEHEYKPPLIMKLFQTSTFVLGREIYSGNCIIPSVKLFFSAAVDDLEKKRNEILFKELLAEAKRVKKAEEEEALALKMAQRRRKRWKRVKMKIMTVLENIRAIFVKIFKRIKCKIKRSCADIERSNLIEYEEDDTLDWWVKYYASRELKRDSTGTETLVIYEEELEAQPEFRGFSDFIYTFDFVIGKGKKISGSQKSVGKVKAAIKLYRWPLEDGSHHTLNGVDIRKGVLKQLPSNASIKYVARIYVVSCKNLTPKDLYGKSDPYLILQIGNRRINDRKNYIPKQVNPVFGKCFELRGTFPKEHLLRIKVMDHDIFSEDDLIGETLIDLENRYYSKHHASCGLPKTYTRKGYMAWRDAYRPTEILKMVCKQSNMQNPVYTDKSVRIGEYEFQGVVTNRKHEMEIHALAALKKWHEIPIHGFHLVPEHVETRALYHPSFPGVEQGKIEMWIDIFPADFRYVPPIVDIEPRKPIAMELRVIVWNVEEVILNDTTLFFNEKMSDIYVQGWLNALEDDKQVTDVHYRSMNGEGNFNWRFIFPFKYIASERRLVVFKKHNVFDTEPEEMKFPCKLELQVWDNDFFSDDFLGSLNLELCSMPRGAKISTTCKLNMFEEATPKINLFKIRRTRGWWPFRRIVDAESSEYSLTGKIDLELEVMTEKEAQENPVGKARNEPKALPEPKRPESSFIWFLNPLKTFKYIICKKYGKTIIVLLIVLMLIAFLLLGIYSLPGYTVKKILRA